MTGSGLSSGCGSGEGIGLLFEVETVRTDVRIVLCRGGMRREGKIGAVEGKRLQARVNIHRAFGLEAGEGLMPASLLL
jgi:hypothetical protein